MTWGSCSMIFFFFSSRRRHTRWNCDWSSDVCSSDLAVNGLATGVQVGYGYASQPTYRQQYHALLWRGSAGSLVDLHPAGYNGSIAYAADGNVQAGSAWTSGIGSHATIWSGSASSVVDLNPPGTTGSEAYAVSN